MLSSDLIELFDVAGLMIIENHTSILSNKIVLLEILPCEDTQPFADEGPREYEARSQAKCDGRVRALGCFFASTCIGITLELLLTTGTEVLPILLSAAIFAIAPTSLGASGWTAAKLVTAFTGAL